MADLSLELSDAKLAAADLKEQVVALREKISTLKTQQLPTEKPEIERGCYYFDDDIDRLYCAACYDSKGLKSLTARAPGNYRICGVCKHAAK